MQTNIRAEVRLLRRPTGQWIALAKVQTPSGPLILMAQADEMAIRKVLAMAVRQQLARAQVNGVEIGGLFGSLKKKLKKLAKKIARVKVLKKVAATVKKVATSPAIASALGIAAPFIPALAPLAQGLQAIQAAAKGPMGIIQNLQPVQMAKAWKQGGFANLPQVKLAKKLAPLVKKALKSGDPKQRVAAKRVAQRLAPSLRQAVTMAKVQAASNTAKQARTAARVIKPALEQGLIRLTIDPRTRKVTVAGNDYEDQGTVVGAVDLPTVSGYVGFNPIFESPFVETSGWGRMSRGGLDAMRQLGDARRIYR